MHLPLLLRVFLFSSFCLSQSALAIILVGGDNLTNITDPGYDLPWDQVARVTNASGSHKTSGSAVYLGGGYMLTANHVELGQGYVSFDGTTTYAIQAGSGVQVGSGVDLKVFQLTAAPGFSGVNLFPEAFKGFESTSSTLVGWGVGVSDDPVDTSNPWSWGDSSTSLKRWGTNTIGAATIVSYSGYSYEALVTSLGTDVGSSEAAATVYDSGSALFVQDGAANWYLAGMPTVVENNSISNFGTDTFDPSDSTRGDFNYFARISEYQEEITALMTDPIVVPEPAMSALLIGLMASGFLLVRRRKRAD